MILKYGEISSCRYPSLLCCLNQLFVMFFQFISQKKTLFVFTKLPESFIVSQLLPSGLDSKISLPCRNNRFRRVAVLYYQVTGIAGEMNIFKFSLSP